MQKTEGLRIKDVLFLPGGKIFEFHSDSNFRSHFDSHSPSVQALLLFAWPSFDSAKSFHCIKVLLRHRIPTALRLCYFLLDQKVTKKSRTASGTFLLCLVDFSESRFALMIVNCWKFAVRCFLLRQFFSKKKLSCKKRRESRRQTANCKHVRDAVRS